MTRISTQVVSSFDHPAVGEGIWTELLSIGDTDVGSLTWRSLRLWWLHNERRDGLRLILACRDGKPVAIAPLFEEAGMAINLCPVNRLDFVGDVSDAGVLDAIVLTAMRSVKNFCGLRMYFVPVCSRTGGFLRQAAERLGLECYLEEEQPSPIIDLRGCPDAAAACIAKKTVLRHEKQLRRGGTLETRHFHDIDGVMSQLDEFFQQHIARWAGTPTPSKFCGSKARQSFRLRTQELARSGWLRFSRLNWNGRAIAFHRGACYKGHYKYGRTTYDVGLSRYSPGAVLMRHLLLAALDEGAHTFDFGIGAEAYKYQYATHEVSVQTWGLYPRRTAGGGLMRKSGD